MNIIKLFHYSNTDFKGKISPRFFGDNCYSRHSSRISGVKRSYFYLDGVTKEGIFTGSRFLYLAEIKKSELYNLNIDNLKLAGKSKDIFSAVKRLGYRGLIGNNGQDIAVLFYPIKIKDKKERF